MVIQTTSLQFVLCPKSDLPVSTLMAHLQKPWANGKTIFDHSTYCTPYHQLGSRHSNFFLGFSYAKSIKGLIILITCCFITITMEVVTYSVSLQHYTRFQKEIGFVGHTFFMKPSKANNPSLDIDFNYIMLCTGLSSHRGQNYTHNSQKWHVAT